MKGRKTELVLKTILKRIDPRKEELSLIRNNLSVFIKNLEKKIKSKKISAKIFVGGSFAKKTIIKKGIYDIDIFVRFDKKHMNQNISLLTKKILQGNKNITLLKGSRDYFRIKPGKNFFFEIIPVMEVKSPKDSNNITDLSYSHVNYVRRKIKSQKILEDIKIAKSFCHANGCYGAESYIQGFSGYGLELLIYHYGGFTKFLKAAVKIKNIEVIDIEKKHKNKKTILMDLNSAKLDSPIILIDPTYKQRNVLAALSEETFKRFQKVCKKFLKNPSLDSFEIKKINFEKTKNDAKKNKLEFILYKIKTKKQTGDIAATKLLKFHRHLNKEISKYFEIKNSGFEYNEKKAAKCFFVAKNKKEIILQGPKLNDKKNVAKFKRVHKNTFKKSGRIYSKQKINYSLEKFVISWKKKNVKKLKEMSVSSLNVLVSN